MAFFFLFFVQNEKLSTSFSRTQIPKFFKNSVFAKKKSVPEQGIYENFQKCSPKNLQFFRKLSYKKAKLSFPEILET